VAGSVAEQLAFEFYERVDKDPCEPESPFTLARLYLGPGCIERGRFSSPAVTFIANGRRRIALRRGIPIEYAAFYVGHELGHAVLEEAGYHEDDLEEQCNLFAAAIMAPRPAVMRLHRTFGYDLESIAGEVGSTETWAALRLGEVLHVPLVAIAPLTIRVRGPEEWVWPDETTLRGWVRRTPPGIAKTRLTDDPRRVVFVVDTSVSTG
jgi:IrrE N-terminal-like domain